MPIPGWLEIVVVLVIVLLLFGPGRIGKVAKEMGSGLRNFKKGITGEDEDEEEDKKK
jgi:sec-independent protein translocase protein TatA